MSDERPIPEVTGLCLVCKVTEPEVQSGYVLVSPTGVAHHSNQASYGDTYCGKDATGENWWWPL